MWIALRQHAYRDLLANAHLQLAGEAGSGRPDKSSVQAGPHLIDADHAVVQRLCTPPGACKVLGKEVGCQAVPAQPCGVRDSVPAELSVPSELPGLPITLPWHCGQRCKLRERAARPCQCCRLAARLDRAHSVSLAILMASSSYLNLKTGMAGPNVSSR